MPSTIVNIESVYSCSKSYHIDTTMPADLRSLGGVHDVEWKSFCDQVNKRLEPLNNLQRIFQIPSALVFIGNAAFMVIFIYRITSSSKKPTNMKNIALLFLIPLSLTVVMIGVNCYISIESQKVYNGIHDICVDASTRNRNVSYHFRIIGRQGDPDQDVECCGITDMAHSRKFYIEVIFGGSNEMSVVEEPTTVPVAVLMTPEVDVIFSSNETSVVEEPTTLPVAVALRI